MCSSDLGSAKVTLCKPKGCARCNQSGYSGRLAIHEVFVINDAIRTLVSQHATALEIEAAARQFGYQGMRYDGFKKVLRGLTTIEEINRVVTED